MYLDEIPPQKADERTHIERQFLRWSKYWEKCPDPKKREELFKQANILGHMVEQRLMDKYRSGR